MAQCKRILPNDEQCSNRAVPGTDYCEQHGRIQFRRVTEISPVPAPPEAGREKKAEKPPPPRWVARPSAVGATPVFPGLRADARNVLVAPRACIWLSAQGPQDQPAPLFERMVRLLAALSQATPLPGHVTVRAAPEEGGALISLSPPQPDVLDLSRFYDAAASAAALSGGLLYVGQERAFIQYRDGAAPRGYDVEGEEEVELPPGDEWYLVDREGTHPLLPQALTEVPLDELLMRVAPIPARAVALPEVAFALVAPPLYRMLARYFRDHHLRYRVARFHAPLSPPPGGGGQGEGEETLVLFEIAPRPDAPTGVLLPAFVLSYLDGLPRCVVLTEAWAEAGRRMLVEWRSRYPCLPRHVLGAFPADSLLLFPAGPDFASLCVAPIPTFFEGDELAEVHTPRPARGDLTPLAGRDKLPLELAVRLVPDAGPMPSTAALVLDVEEMAWVRRLLYRLPGEAFAAYTLCLGQEHAVLVGEGLPVEALPFGIPLRRVQDTQLFIPLRARFAPDLSWTLLAESLALRDDAYTFLTPEFRLDVPRSGFAPLSRALVADPGRPRVAFEVRPAPTLPPLRWTPPGPEQAPSAVAGLPAEPRARQPLGEGKPPGPIERLIGRGTQPAPLPSEGLEPVVVRQVEPQDAEGWLRERAESYRHEGDYLSAALCFALSGDAVEAGRCYRQGAHGLQDR